MKKMTTAQRLRPEHRPLVRRAARPPHWALRRALTCGLLVLGSALAQADPAAAAPSPTATSALGPASSYLALGLTAYQAGRFDQAYVAFRAASESDPGNTEALLGLGRTQARLRLFGASLQTLQRLLQLDPGNLSGAVALAQTYTEQFAAATDRAGVAGNLAQALKVLQAAEPVAQATARPEERAAALAKVWNQRSVVYKLQGDYPAAITALQRAAKLEPDNSVILFNLGDLYFGMGNLASALDNLQQAVIADPNDAFNRAYYAKLLALSGNTGAARSEAAQAARLAPQNAYAVGQYGVVAYLAGDPATARGQLGAALKLDPLRYPEFYYYLGRLDLDGGQLAGARSDLTKAVALASNNAEYLYYLGLSYERAGLNASADRAKARDNYQRALRLSPGFKLAQEALVRVK